MCGVLWSRVVEDSHSGRDHVWDVVSRALWKIEGLRHAPTIQKCSISFSNRFSLQGFATVSACSDDDTVYLACCRFKLFLLAARDIIWLYSSGSGTATVFSTTSWCKLFSIRSWQAVWTLFLLCCGDLGNFPQKRKLGVFCPNQFWGGLGSSTEGSRFHRRGSGRVGVVFQK